MIENKKQKLVKTSGITLVALVVTIVILIILATVTISATFGENGLIKQAQKTKESAENFVQSEEHEMNKLLQEYANMMEEDAGTPEPEPEVDTIPPVITVTVGETTTNSITVNVQVVDNESGMKENPMYTYYLKKSSEAEGSYQAKATDVTNSSYTFAGLEQETSYDIKVEVDGDKAGNKGEKGITASTSKKIVTDVIDLKEGDYVNYIDKKGQTRKCVVLYDSSSSYGIQIITMDTVEDVILGSSGDSQFDTNIFSYNNVIKILNNKAKEYNNSTYSSGARCVGSRPSNPNYDSAGMYTSDESWFSDYNGKFKDRDYNYQTDLNKMKKINGGIHKIGKDYFLASRVINSGSNTTFGCIAINKYAEDSIYNYPLISLWDDGRKYATECSAGLRPVFTINHGIKVTAGNGENNSPYILGV